MKDFKNIILGEGLGKLKFGCTRDEALELIGKPDEIEQFSYDEASDDVTEAWHFDDLDLSLSFDEQEDWLLSTIAVSSGDYLLESKEVFGKSIEEVLQIVSKLELGDYHTEKITLEEGVESTLLNFEDFSLNLWFENDALTEIQWSFLEEIDEMDSEIPFSAN